MKQILITTIAAVLIVGCGESQQSVPQTETKPEAPTAKEADISIHHAAATGNIETVKKHLAAGKDVNSKLGGRSLLHYAISSRGRKEIVELLISKGANLHSKDVFGVTPLHLAALSGQTEIAEILIEKGANINERNNEGESPLDITQKTFPLDTDEIKTARKKTGDFLRERGARRVKN
jgi:hypothetical protein